MNLEDWRPASRAPSRLQVVRIEKHCPRIADCESPLRALMLKGDIAHNRFVSEGGIMQNDLIERGWTDMNAASPKNGAVAACQTARGPAGASIAVKPQTRAAVAIAPREGQSKANSKISARATGTATRAPRRSAGPGSAGPIARSGEARRRWTSPEALAHSCSTPRVSRSASEPGARSASRSSNS